MRHPTFLFQIISFKKYFYVSLCNNFFTVFMEAPRVVEALGNCPVCRPLNPALPQQTAGDIDRLLHGAPQRRGTTPLPRCQRT